MKQFLGKITKLLGSRRFFYGVVIFFVLESVWIACSARYPMAFDEDFHLGIIKIYSQHWLPFLSTQPDNAMQYGALQHDPSYLYHYLMSFPYRMVSAVTSSQTIQVVVLRLLNVAMAAWGVWLFRAVLRRAGTSAALTHTLLALFVLVPVVPMVAGQINYDNLLMPLVALLCLLTFTVFSGLQQRWVNVRAFVLLAVVCMAGSLVKYPFLPFAAAAVAFVAGAAAWYFRGTFRQLPAAIAAGYKTVTPRLRVGLLVLAVVTGGLFIQRYGVNLVTYHTPVPECDVVLSQEDCLGYGPWARNHLLAQDKKEVTRNAAEYTWYWLQALHFRLFFAVNGPADSYRNYPPLPLPSATTVLLTISGIIGVLLYWRRVFAGRPLLVLFLLMTLLYCGVLWSDDYSQYLETSEPVAINGRYLLPVLLPLGAVLAQAFRVIIGRRPAVKAAVAGVVILLFLQGGGVFSFILRSDEIWYWPDSTVIHINNGARRVLAPVVIEGLKYY
jgi:hypothetical protein